MEDPHLKKLQMTAEDIFDDFGLKNTLFGPLSALTYYADYSEQATLSNANLPEFNIKVGVFRTDIGPVCCFRCTEGTIDREDYANKKISKRVHFYAQTIHADLLAAFKKSLVEPMVESQKRPCVFTSKRVGPGKIEQEDVILADIDSHLVDPAARADGATHAVKSILKLFDQADRIPVEELEERFHVHLKRLESRYQSAISYCQTHHAPGHGYPVCTAAFIPELPEVASARVADHHKVFSLFSQYLEWRTLLSNIHGLVLCQDHQSWD